MAEQRAADAEAGEPGVPAAGGRPEQRQHHRRDQQEQPGQVAAARARPGRRGRSAAPVAELAVAERARVDRGDLPLGDQRGEQRPPRRAPRPSGTSRRSPARLAPNPVRLRRRPTGGGVSGLGPNSITAPSGGGGGRGRSAAAVSGHGIHDGPCAGRPASARRRWTSVWRMPIRTASARWEGNLTEGSGTIKTGKGGLRGELLLQVPLRGGRGDEPRGADRRRARRLLLDGVLQGPRRRRLHADLGRDHRQGAPRQDRRRLRRHPHRPRDRGRRPRHRRGHVPEDRRGRQGELPDLPAALARAPRSP